MHKIIGRKLQDILKSITSSNLIFMSDEQKRRLAKAKSDNKNII